MKERPILFSGPMVRALLDGTKTQTRRIGKIQSPEYTELGVEYCEHATKGTIAQATYRAFPEGGSARWAICECPYGIEGDRLWVKETHLPKASGILYRADLDSVEAAGIGGMYGGWKPSIFCRREYSRITLEIVSIRVERLQDISEEDAEAEGIEPGERFATGCSQTITFKDCYHLLWEDINGPGSWDANPWVWVVEFKRINPEPQPKTP